MRPHYGLLLLAARRWSASARRSSIPESSRVARLASGGRHGLAQSLFQVGGNVGSALGPLLAAFIVVPRGQASVAWFSVAALVGMACCGRSAPGTSNHRKANGAKRPAAAPASGARQAARWSIALIVLVVLIFSKNVYHGEHSSYYTFYLIHKFGVSVQASQLLLFVFLGGVGRRHDLGGPIGDRFGAKTVIWFSILGVLPFTLVLPLCATCSGRSSSPCIIGMIMASAFPGDPGLRAGTGAGPGRACRRHLLRLRLRHGRHRRRGAGRARRCHRHRVRSTASAPICRSSGC